MKSDWDQNFWNKFVIIPGIAFKLFVFHSFHQPKVVTATDEAELARQMERAELENAEVAGDDDEEEVEGMGDFSEGEGDDDLKANDGLLED